MVYSTLLLFLLFGISQSISFLARAPGLNIQKISFPVERNGIKYEFGYYGVVLTFSEDTINIFPNFETLAGLALAAFEEAQALSPSSGGFEGMAVMITGNEAYLASPMRKLSGGSSGGLTYFFYDVLGGNAPLRQQLAACQLSLTEAKGKDIIHKRHNNKANCGEIVNMQASI
jgi:hypothetical protein